LIRNLMVIGGDQRMRMLTKLLTNEGYTVNELGTDKGDGGEERISQADALLFPYPFAVKEDRVPTMNDEVISPRWVLERAKPGIPVLAGKGLDAYITEMTSSSKPFVLRHYMDDPIFAQRNADISAEAAVYELMKRSRCMLDEETVLVLGYGLFGRAIARILKAFHTEVWVVARREKQRMQAVSDGMQAFDIGWIDQLAPRVDAVLNTVPAVLLDEALLGRFSADVLLLELASPPYGMDLSAAAKMNLSATVLPSLPSRYAPLSAARALKDASMRLMMEGSL